MKRLIAFFLLLMCTGMAFADSSNSSLLSPDAITKYTDMSVFYLGQIFGTVEGTLTNSSSQMLGHLFYMLNMGILVICGILVGYTVLLSTIRLASEGVTIAPGKSTLFALIKIAVGVALAFPSASTGYSVLQNIVMQVVVKGVGLADSVWSAGLDYLDKGGVVWSKPVSDNPKNPYLALLEQKNLDALLGKNLLAAKVFQNEICMVGSRDPLGQPNQSKVSNVIVAEAKARPYYDVQVRESLHRFDFPGLTDKKMVVDNPSCGSISWDINGACDDPNSGACSISRDAVSKLITSLLPAAKNYYCFKHGSADSCANYQTFSSVNSGLAPYLVDSLVNYYPAMQIYADMKQQQAAGTKKDFIAAAKKEGWLMAGRYYWNIMKFTRLDEASSDLSNYAPAQVVVSPHGMDVAPELRDIVNTYAVADFNDTYGGATGAGKGKDFKDALDQVTQSGGPSNNGRAIGEKSGGNIMNDNAGMAAIGGTVVFNPGVSSTFWMVLNRLDNIGSMFKNWGDYGYNPIQFFYKLGQACLTLTMLIWIVGGVLIAGSVAAYSICAASNPLGFASTALAEWMRPIFMMIATMLWMAGFFLSYYVPLYPFMIFLFASFGWFIAVIEAMVAAPLVALGLTHPEAHDLLGKSEQALMLLLSVFIQPSLLVVGLIAGIVVSYVSFELLIYTFSGFIVDIMGNGVSGAATTNILAAAQNSTLYNGANLLVQPVLLILFCTIAYTLLTQSFSLIHLLRDNVMKWIGAPTTGLPNPEQMVGDTKGALSSFGSQSGQAGSSGAGAGSSSFGGADWKGWSEGKGASQGKGAEQTAPPADNKPSEKPGGKDPNGGAPPVSPTTVATGGAGG